MGWSSMSFPLSSYLPSSTMNAVFSNFASLAAQESGAPVINSLNALGFNTFGHVEVTSGVSAPQTSSFGTLNALQLNVASGLSAPQASSMGVLDVHSQYTLNGNIAKALIQSVFASTYATQANTTATFSTYIVASLTPKFSDSLIVVEADLIGESTGGGGGSEQMRANLCRAPNGTPVVLTTSAAASTAMDAIGSTLANFLLLAPLHFSYQETSPASGTALQYGLRFAATNAVNANVVNANGARIRVQEWR